jgi:hypothetical protein
MRVSSGYLGKCFVERNPEYKETSARINQAEVQRFMSGDSTMQQRL